MNPFRSGFWRSPIRGPWLTSVLGLVLLAGIPVLFVTGLLSYLQPGPAGQRHQGPRGRADLRARRLADPPVLALPGHPGPARDARHRAGARVAGQAVVGDPEAVEWPPVRSPAHALERASLFLLVGGGVFTFAPGLLNIQYWYTIPGSFYRLHYYSSWSSWLRSERTSSSSSPSCARSCGSAAVRDELRVGLAQT